MTQASLVVNNKNNIDLVLQPVKDASQILEATIHELIESSEFKDLYIDNGNIKNAIAELNSALKPLQANKSGKEITYQILERRDATITISIEKDEMSASAEISTALGGKHLSAKAILNSAQQSGVTKGFTKEQLLGLAHKAAKEPPGSIVKGEIAKGKEPVNGDNSQIKLLVQSAQDRILRPKEREDGSVDMRDLGDIICVKVGEPLAKKIPLSEGEKGFTVTGTPIEPVAGEDVNMQVGEGTAISKKNNQVLISTLIGLPRIIENGMEVDGVYRIKNVDVSTGHIKFEGSVIIDGDICEGMRVAATGDISVGGFVESATLDAGGDITIGTGIIGRKQDVEDILVDEIQMSVSINAKGKVYAKYCQYAEISCHSLRIENQMMHSIIDVEETLWLGSEDKANGKLIAGYIQAGKSVHAGIVGATAGSTTIISFSKKVEDMKEHLEDIEAKLKIDTEKAAELQIAVNKLNKLPKDKVNPDMLNKVVSTYKFHANRMAEFLNEKESFEERLQSYMTSVFVEATEKLYHGVQLIVGDFHDKTRREYGPTKMSYKERKIHLDSIVNT
ncbi:MAG: FapA family protein [Alteromonadaceae bacterium]